ncbi:MAG: dihydrofolate reductase [Lachnospiraceae bacterium]|nr:dihydrofolate reductase [Lachnospiraceae bacterium]
MRAIAAVDKNWAIGNRGQLLVSIPADQRFFRGETLGKTVILGRKTMDTFPGGRPLKSRRNIILTRDPNYSIVDAETVQSIYELMELIKDVKSEEVYVIGGQSVYEQLLPYCDEAYITKINYEYQADAYFPNLDEDEEWKCVSVSEEETYWDLEYRFCVYKRKKKLLTGDREECLDELKNVINNKS